MSEAQPKFDPKLAEGIAYFEQMLQVMPDDRTTLEFLCVAYEQIGENDKRRRALVGLANVLLKEGDLESAERIAERLDQYAEPDARAMALRVRAARTPAATPVATPDEPAPAAVLAADEAPAADVGAALAAETALVRRLVEQKLLDDADAATTLQRLGELAEGNGRFLVSAVAVLEKENGGLAESAVAWMADEAGAPPIPIESFDVSEHLQRLPAALVRLRGALPFAKMGEVTLVAVLNPLDADLKRQIEARLGGPCRLFLAHPRALEELLDRLFAEAAAENEAATAAENEAGNETPENAAEG